MPFWGRWCFLGWLLSSIFPGDEGRSLSDLPPCANKCDRTSGKEAVVRWPGMEGAGPPQAEETQRRWGKEGRRIRDWGFPGTAAAWGKEAWASGDAA